MYINSEKVNKKIVVFGNEKNVVFGNEKNVHGEKIVYRKKTVFFGKKNTTVCRNIRKIFGLLLKINTYKPVFWK